MIIPLPLFSTTPTTRNPTTAARSLLVLFSRLIGAQSSVLPSVTIDCAEKQCKHYLSPRNSSSYHDRSISTNFNPLSRSRKVLLTPLLAHHASLPSPSLSSLPLSLSLAPNHLSSFVPFASPPSLSPSQLPE